MIGDRIAARGDAVRQAERVPIRFRGPVARSTLHLTLVERDGSSWATELRRDTTWTERSIPLADFCPARSVRLPEGYPGESSYWVCAPAGCGGHGGRIRLTEVERLQFSLRAADPVRTGVEVEWVTLDLK